MSKKFAQLIITLNEKISIDITQNIDLCQDIPTLTAPSTATLPAHATPPAHRLSGQTTHNFAFSGTLLFNRRKHLTDSLRKPECETPAAVEITERNPHSPVERKILVISATPRIPTLIASLFQFARYRSILLNKLS
jgi:hypothetical protein